LALPSPSFGRDAAFRKERSSALLASLISVQKARRKPNEAGERRERNDSIAPCRDAGGDLTHHEPSRSRGARRRVADQAVGGE